MVILYVDMDGVIARWKSASEEEVNAKGFFLACEQETGIIDAVLNLYKKGYVIKILSAANMHGTAVQEKRAWLKRAHFPEDIERIFVPYGQPKCRFVKKIPGTVNILLDDYSKNLHEWKNDGNIGIKFRNRVNGSHGTWTGDSVDYRSKTLVSDIEQVLRRY